ncbi:MAG: AzlD domain-containing protein [Pseudomonadota bacterium]
MIAASDWQIWLVIIALGIGTFLVRFSFLGLLGQRDLPDWALRHLRYTAVAVLPALIAPLLVWPEANGGEPEPLRLTAAAMTLAVGYLTGNGIWAIVAGFGSFYALGAIFG